MDNLFVKSLSLLEHPQQVGMPESLICGIRVLVSVHISVMQPVIMCPVSTLPSVAKVPDIIRAASRTLLGLYVL